MRTAAGRVSKALNTIGRVRQNTWASMLLCSKQPRWVISVLGESDKVFSRPHLKDAFQFSSGRTHETAGGISVPVVAGIFATKITRQFIHLLVRTAGFGPERTNSRGLAFLKATSPSRTLQVNIENFCGMGRCRMIRKIGIEIGQSEKKILLVMTDAGSAAAHRGWRPEPEHLDKILEATEALLHRLVVLGPAAAKLRETVPPRPRPPK